MAKSTLKNRFEKLYLEIKDTLDSETNTILQKLRLLENHDLWDFQNSLFSSLEKEFMDIAKLTAQTHRISINDLELAGTIWDEYAVELEIEGDCIRKESYILYNDDEESVDDEVHITLQHYLAEAIAKIKVELHITGTVIDFFLELNEM